MGCVCVKGMQGVPQEVISGGKIDKTRGRFETTVCQGDVPECHIERKNEPSCYIFKQRDVTKWHVRDH